MRLSLLTNGNMEKQRTLKQNNSIHKYCELLAKELNTLGLDMRIVLKPDYKIWWTMESIKENIVKPIAEAMYNVDSTTKLERQQIDKVHEQIMHMLCEKYPGLDYIPFPSAENTDDYWKDYK